MPLNTGHQIKGQRAELLAAAEFESQGFPVCNISNRDFGLDLALYVPMRPPTCRQVDEIIDSVSEDYIEISAEFIHAQVKSSDKHTIKFSHLQQWAAAIDSGATIILVYVSSGKISTLYGPGAISAAYATAINNNQATISMTTVEADDVFSFTDAPSNQLGVILYSLAMCPTIAIDFESIRKVEDGESFREFVQAHQDLIDSFVFSEYPAGRALDRELELGADGVKREVYSVLSELWTAFKLGTPENNELDDLAVGEVGRISDFEYQGNKYTQYQYKDDFFRGVPSPRLGRDFKNFCSLIEVMRES